MEHIKKNKRSLVLSFSEVAEESPCLLPRCALVLKSSIGRRKVLLGGWKSISSTFLKSIIHKFYRIFDLILSYPCLPSPHRWETTSGAPGRRLRLQDRFKKEKFSHTHTQTHTPLTTANGSLLVLDFRPSRKRQLPVQQSLPA